MKGDISKCPYASMMQKKSDDGEKKPYPEFVEKFIKGGKGKGKKSSQKVGGCPYSENMMEEAKAKCPHFQAEMKATVVVSECPYPEMAIKWKSFGKDRCLFEDLAEIAKERCPVFRPGTYNFKKGNSCPFKEFSNRAMVAPGRCPHPDMMKLATKK